MRSRPSKREVEAHYLKLARERLPEFCPGQIVDDAGERPDFLVRRHDGRIWGVEITCLYQEGGSSQPPPKAKDANALRIAERAQAIFERDISIPLSVSTILSEPANPNRSDVERLARWVAQEVANNAVKFDRSKKAIIEIDTLRVDSPPEIASLRVCYMPEVTRSHWHSPRAGFVGLVDANRMQREIRKKETRLSEYLKRCDWCALLLVAEGFAPSEALQLAETAAAATYATGFVSVAWLEVLEHRGRILRTVPKSEQSL